MMDKNIGFVGLGRMGGNMARCLKDKGYQISCVYDIDMSISKGLAEELSTKAVDSLVEVSEKSDVVFTVVTDDAAMELIFYGNENLMTKSDGVTFINCATLTPDLHRKLKVDLGMAGARCLEACMASSIPQARNGELYLMIGGDESAFNQQKDLLDDLSKALHYVGPIGKASEVKALVNMIMNINTAALAEGLGLGKALGLDLEMLCQVFEQTGANSRVLETDAEDMLNRDHDCYFSAEHAAKDSGIALELAKGNGLRLPLAAATLEQYTLLMKKGLGGLDKSAVAELTFPGRSS